MGIKDFTLYLDFLKQCINTITRLTINCRNSRKALKISSLTFNENYMCHEKNKLAVNRLFWDKAWASPQHEIILVGTMGLQQWGIVGGIKQHANTLSGH